jgi:hypothetical protein
MNQQNSLVIKCVQLSRLAIPGNGITGSDLARYCCACSVSMATKWKTMHGVAECKLAMYSTRAGCLGYPVLLGIPCRHDE